ncbi:hypothetical protein JCM10207_005239 [Rhodosporidiobolus poonsookiae]
MVPAPRPFEVPPHPYMNADPNLCLPSSEPLPALPSDSTNVSGRWWKQEHKATVRVQNGKSDKLKLDKKWKQREEQRKKDEAIKKLERGIKEEKEAEAEQKRTALKERREKEAEKKRLQEMAARMSAKKLQRMKKRMGRNAKVNQ